MGWYHWVLAALACLAVTSAWRVPRAVQWVSLLALSFVTSAMYHRAGLPYATAFGAGTNLVLCYMLWIFADQRWEMRVWNCIHLMLVVDMIYMAGLLRDHVIFSSTLEVVNAVALLLITATGAMERANGSRLGPDRAGWTGFVYRRLWPERSPDYRPWWQKAP